MIDQRPVNQIGNERSAQDQAPVFHTTQRNHAARTDADTIEALRQVGQIDLRDHDTQQGPGVVARRRSNVEDRAP